MKPTHPDIAFFLLTNVRNTFLYGRPEDSIYKGAGAHFICWELTQSCAEMVHRGFPQAAELGQTVREMQAYVTGNLADQRGQHHAGLVGWVRASCPTAPLLNGMGHQLRLAWIDRMIFQLEQDGTLP